MYDWLRRARGAQVLLALVAVVLGLQPPPAGAVTISLAGCPNATAGVTEFGTVYRGQPRVTTSDCTIVFGDAVGTSMLKLYQQDGAAPALTTLVPAGLVAAWHLNESSGTFATDATGNGNNGVFTGGYTLGAAGAPTGVTDDAISFNGTGGQMTVAPTNPTTLSGAFTVSLWFKPATGDDRTIINTRAPNDQSFDIQQRVATGLHGDIGNGSSWLTTSADATHALTPGTWYHVAYAVDGSGYDIYVGGAPVASGSYSGTPLLWDYNHVLRIGGGIGDSFSGSIDEVRVYNRKLTPAEIATEPTTVDVNMQVGDFAAGTRDWTAGANMFGACLRTVSGAGVSGTWTVDGNSTCTAVNTDPWNAIAPTVNAGGAKVAQATTAGVTNATVNLRFGLRPASDQPVGTYTARLVAESFTPNV